MALEQASVSLEEKKKHELLSEIQNLEAKLRTLLPEAPATEVIRGPAPDSTRSKPSFFLDLAIGVGIFVLTAVCFAMRVPVLGHPLALLASPIVTLLLSWRHRP